MKEELSQKKKLSIYWSVFIPILTCGHEVWITSERTRSQIQAFKISFLHRVAGLILRDRVEINPENTGEIEYLLWPGNVSQDKVERVTGERDA